MRGLTGRRWNLIRTKLKHQPSCGNCFKPGVSTTPLADVLSLSFSKVLLLQYIAVYILSNFACKFRATYRISIQGQHHLHGFSVGLIKIGKTATRVLNGTARRVVRHGRKGYAQLQLGLLVPRLRDKHHSGLPPHPPRYRA